MYVRTGLDEDDMGVAAPGCLLQHREPDLLAPQHEAAGRRFQVLRALEEGLGAQHLARKVSVVLRPWAEHDVDGEVVRGRDRLQVAQRGAEHRRALVGDARAAAQLVHLVRERREVRGEVHAQDGEAVMRCAMVVG